MQDVLFLGLELRWGTLSLSYDLAMDVLLCGFWKEFSHNVIELLR